MIENRKKNKRIAFWGTFIFTGSTLTLLILLGFATPLPLPEEEGILVNFGYDNTGFGEIETSQETTPEPISIPEESTPPPTELSKAEKEVLITQDFEDAAAVEAQKEAQRKHEENIRKQKEKEDQIQKKKEAEEKQKKEEQEKKKIQELTKNAFSQGKNTKGNSKSDGNTSGTGNMGNPDGDPNAKNYGDGKGLGNKGIGYSLKGRTPQGGKLPKPNYTANESGTIVIQVTVDRNGNITSARYKAKGSNTTNKQLINAALTAARKARFNSDASADPFQVGTITYRFVLN